MDSTTLFTFLLHHSYATSVELFGSWDNFSRSYRMQRDRRRGHGHWTGCWTFDNIICDGDLSQPYEKRDGGLKQGGTYWYYYRVDGDAEYHDPSVPATTACPLLPGQKMNILDVPHEHSSKPFKTPVDPATAHTWNPEDRYQAPRPAPKPALPQIITDLSGISRAKLPPGPWETYRYPKSADSYWHQQKSPLEDRDIHSAAPTAFPESALSPLQGPQSGITPSQGGRGRSRTLPPSHDRSTRTHSPSQRAPKGSSPVPLVGPGQEGLKCLPALRALKASPSMPLMMQKTSAPPLSPLGSHPVTAEDLSRFRLPKRRAVPPNHSRQNSEAPSTDGRASCPSRDGSGACAKACPICKSAESIARRRSISTGRMREPSPLRNSISIDASDEMEVHVPEDIQEVDESQPTPRAIPTETIKPSLQAPTTETILLRPHTSNCTPVRFPLSPLDKDLPDLPAYLYPSPLRINASFNSLPADLDDLDLDPLGPCSRFSAWTVSTASFPNSPTSPIPSLPASPAFPNPHGHPAPEPPSEPHSPESLSSPTFSSLCDFSMDGHSTPRRTSSVVSFDAPSRSASPPVAAPHLPPLSADALEHRERTYRLLGGSPIPPTSSTFAGLFPPMVSERAPSPSRAMGAEGSTVMGKNGLGGMEKRAMTAMEELMSEFEYLGGALL